MEFYSPSQEGWNAIVDKEYPLEPSPLFISCLKNAIVQNINIKHQLYFNDILVEFAKDLMAIDVNDMYKVGELKRSAMIDTQFILGRLPKCNPYINICEIAVQNGINAIIEKAKKGE